MAALNPFLHPATNFLGKHCTSSIYSLHIRRRVLASLVQFVNPLLYAACVAQTRRRPLTAQQVTWPVAKDLFSCCWRTANSQISFYRAKGLYNRPIAELREPKCFRVAVARAKILLDSFMYHKRYTLKTSTLGRDVAILKRNERV